MAKAAGLARVVTAERAQLFARDVQKVLDGIVALNADDAQRMRRVVREARAAARLRYPIALRRGKGQAAEMGIGCRRGEGQGEK